MKKLIIALLMLAAITFGGGDRATAMTCLEPGPVEGYDYLSIRYDPMGNAIVFIDKDADGKADFVQVFMLMQDQRTGEVFLMPNGPAMDPEIAAKRMKIVEDHNKAAGEAPKCFDTDTNQLRYESDRWTSL